MSSVAVVRPNPDQVQTKRAVDLHPNILEKELEVTGHILVLMATWLKRFLKRQTNCGRVVVKEKRVNRSGALGRKVPVEDLLCEWLHRKERREIYCRALSWSTCV